MNNAVWMDTKFAFFDEDGSRIEMSAREAIQTATQLTTSMTTSQPVPWARWGLPGLGLGLGLMRAPWLPSPWPR